MPPAARVGDPHSCLMQTAGQPHVGGPILAPGCKTVLIGDKPAARVGDMAECVVGPPDVITAGCPSVLIGDKVAARQGDTTAHGGTIVGGDESVLIG